MSFNLEQVRKAFGDPMLSKIAEFTKRIAKLESDNIEIETDDITGLGDLDNTKVFYNDNINFINKFGDVYDYVLFDGVNDNIDCGNDVDLWSRPLTNFSFSFWIWPTAGGDGQDRRVVEHGVASNQGFGSYIDTAVANRIRFRIKNAAGGTLTAHSDGLIQDRWNHITCTYDKDLVSDNLKIYVNSILGGTTANLTETINLSSTLKLSDSSTDYEGKMRDFRWWTIKTLTQTEIENVMNNSVLAPTANYWLQMNDGPGNPTDFIFGVKTGSLTSGAGFVTRVHPQCPFEPDYNKLCLDLRFDNLGYTLTDFSGLGNTAEIYGEPCPTIGSNVGYRGGSKKNAAHRVLQSEQIHYEVADTGDLRMLGETVGQSWIFRVNFKSLNDVDPVSGLTRSQTLVEKFDDTNNKYFIRVGTDGNVKYGVRRAGNEFKIRTNTAPVIAGKDVEIGLTYNVTGDVIKIYIDGIESTTTTTTEVFDSTTSNPNLIIGSAIPVDKGFCDLNYIDLTRLYDDKVLTPTQFNNHFRNKFTISNIDEGQVAICGASVLGMTVIPASFTQTSFTDQSFTTLPH